MLPTICHSFGRAIHLGLCMSVQALRTRRWALPSDLQFFQLSWKGTSTGDWSICSFWKIQAFSKMRPVSLKNIRTATIFKVDTEKIRITVWIVGR
jgi:hypothetical protein